MTGRRAAYPSDLTDEQWAVVGPFLAVWKARHPSVSRHHCALRATEEGLALALHQHWYRSLPLTSL